eukprot:scaffold90459_cov34-Tisochrysis_lutea.AAC.1
MPPNPNLGRPTHLLIQQSTQRGRRNKGTYTYPPLMETDTTVRGKPRDAPCEGMPKKVPLSIILPHSSRSPNPYPSASPSSTTLCAMLEFGMWCIDGVWSTPDSRRLGPFLVKGPT